MPVKLNRHLRAAASMSDSGLHGDTDSAEIYTGRDAADSDFWSTLEQIVSGLPPAFEAARRLK